ncbi:MAG TPA: alpha/beta hydrolase [Myxococcaceae bacterium]|nr:alpha/beta hydrolase [Myxococcaceae bacterium]
MLKRIRTPVLEIAFEEAGTPEGSPVVLLHGFPYDVRAYDGVVDRLGGRCRVLVPYLRGFGPTRFLSADTMRSGQQGALGADLLAFLDALGIDRAIVAGYDWGGRAACIVSALWPERVQGLVSVNGYNIQAIARSGEPHDPEAEHRFWYQFYFHSERGRRGLERNRKAFCRLLWRLWSPSWSFTAEEYERTAASFESSDFVEVVIHSYRHRFGLVRGDPAFDELEHRLAPQPEIVVPTVTLAGADDGVDPPSPPSPRFRDLRAHQVVPGAGHNLPQEAPEAFAGAVLSLL